MSTAIRTHTVPHNRIAAHAQAPTTAPRVRPLPRTEALTPLAITLGLLMWAGLFLIVKAII